MDDQDRAWCVLGTCGTHGAEQQAAEAAVSAAADDEYSGVLTCFQEDPCGTAHGDDLAHRNRRLLAEYLGDGAVQYVCCDLVSSHASYM